jgi:hypothetical protein
MDIDDMLKMKDAGEVCAASGKRIWRGRFAQIRHGDEMVPLCRPLRMETLQKDPGPFAVEARVRRPLKTCRPTAPEPPQRSVPVSPRSWRARSAADEGPAPASPQGDLG